MIQKWPFPRGATMGTNVLLIASLIGKTSLTKADVKLTLMSTIV